MKQLAAIAFAALAVVSVAAQDVPVFLATCQALSEDRNMVRYSPLNLFVAGESGVFASPLPKVIGSSPFLSVFFGSTVNLDGIEIEAGYFDSRYYLANDRIKRLRLVLDAADGGHVEKSYDLKDEMKVQNLRFDAPLDVKAVHVFLSEVYKGNKWDDVVVSGMTFTSGGRELKGRFDPAVFAGSRYPASGIDAVSHESLGEGVVYERNVVEKELVVETWRLDDGAGRPVTETRAENTPDGTDFETTCFVYSDQEAKNPSKAVTLGPDGKVKRTTIYSYSQGRLASESTTGDRTATKQYAYEDGRESVVTETETRPENFVQTTKYYYEAGSMVGEENSQQGSINWYELYQYFREGDRIVCKARIAGMYAGSDMSPEVVAYDYDAEGRVSREYAVLY